MAMLTQSMQGFPTVRIPPCRDGLPIEVCLIAQLGPGVGDRLITDAGNRQREHATFVDALDEPSAKLFGIDLGKSDPTSLYSFSVGKHGHPFHRHAGHRMFTAISGSGGSSLRFSTIPDEVIAAEPEAFARSLHCVEIPPDCLFSVRFGGGTWHQFSPLRSSGGHRALFALSCHSNELGGIEDTALAEAIRNGKADIPTLTELLPETVQRTLALESALGSTGQTTRLSLHSSPGSTIARLCAHVRRCAGSLRRKMAILRARPGSIGREFRLHAISMQRIPADSLLSRQFKDSGFCHEDTFSLSVAHAGLRGRSAPAILADVLEGFLQNRPFGVSLLMRLRNFLVSPLRLRTSPLGCPASSLLGRSDTGLFAGRYPVLDQYISPDGAHAQVLLGADDRHLRFRSCVGVASQKNGQVRITLGTRVHCRNAFGRFYMSVIEGVHRRYISPVMLEQAVAHALQQREAPSQAAATFA